MPSSTFERTFHLEAGHSRRVVAGLVVLGTAATLLVGMLPGPAEAEEPAHADPLTNRGFTVTATQGAVPDAVHGAQISFTDQLVAIYAGCNSITAPAVWSHGNLELTAPARTTRMACDGPSGDAERWLTAFVTATPAWVAAGDGVVLRAGDAALTLTRRR
ncbi:MAG: META domain-containing protein [Promicromonosporaceae bacterium]|nr:META domain-containing protein [Promicromonosporaceae bacterium]